MSDVEQYIVNRRDRSHVFAESFDNGYAAFELGATLCAAREQAGMTRGVIAKKLGTKKSTISRIENHAGDIRLSRLGMYAVTLGKKLRVKLVD